MTDCLRREDCRLCGSAALELVYELAPTPPANEFLAPETIDGPQDRFPLELNLCHDCGHVQLGHVVDPERLFSNYVYVSGTSPSFVAHFARYAEDVWRLADADANDLVVEIGSNDGTLLKEFKRLGARVQGVDPARRIAETAAAEGLPTVAGFFGPEIAETIRTRDGTARIVAANNVCAHIDDLGGLAASVRRLLDDDGLFVFEVSYLLDVLDKALFDTIYHEHLDYHAVAPLLPFLAAHDMDLFHAERVASHGGSVRVIAAPTAAGRPQSDALKVLLDEEAAAGLGEPETYRRFAAQIDAIGARLRDLLRTGKAAGRSCAGYGAPAKATTLMHQFGLSGADLRYIVDDSPWKQGLLSPGLNVPIVPAGHLSADGVDDLLILAWNFADPIIANNRDFLKDGRRFIVPLPELRVVTADD